PALFLTRWVTHFCVPTFIFLAGVSAFLYGERGRSVGQVSLFLLTRGLWLILIEFTVMRFCWTFSFHINVFVLQVIWVTGASMVVLAGLVDLPRGAIAPIGVCLIAGHNLLDRLRAAASRKAPLLATPPAPPPPTRPGRGGWRISPGRWRSAGSSSCSCSITSCLGRG